MVYCKEFRSLVRVPREKESFVLEANRLYHVGYDDFMGVYGGSLTDTRGEVRAQVAGIRDRLAEIDSEEEVEFSEGKTGGGEGKSFDALRDEVLAPVDEAARVFSEATLQAARKALIGLRDEEKFLTQEAVLAAIEDWVRDLTSSSARKGGVFFRVNPHRSRVYNTAIILPMGIGRAKMMSRCPWSLKTGFIPVSVQVTRSQKGDFRVQLINMGDSPVKHGSPVFGHRSAYWESLLCLRNILRDDRVGYNVEDRLVEWFKYRIVFGGVGLDEGGKS